MLGRKEGIITHYDIQIDSKYWRAIADDEIKRSLLNKLNENTAKNVIILIGDGMSIDTITASRIHYKGEANYLGWEKFPHVGLLKVSRDIII